MHPSAKRARSSDAESGHSEDVHSESAGGSGKRGPRRIETPASSKRTMQNREAQRVSRMRHREYVAGLEKKVEELTDALAASAGWPAAERRPTLPCSNPSCIATAAALVQLQAESISARPSPNPSFVMSTPIAGPSRQTPLQQIQHPFPVVAEGSNWKIASATPAFSFEETDLDLWSFLAPVTFSAAGGTAQPSGSVEDWFDVSIFEEIMEGISSKKTAAELYGPFEVDETQKELKALSSLSNSKHVDEMLGLFVTQSHFSDKKTIKSYYKRIVSSKYKILDECNLIDKQKCIEIIERFKTKNRMHLNHLHLNSTHDARKLVQKRSGNAGGASLSQLDAQLQPFKEAVSSIPSLRGASELVEELCLCFASHLTCSKEEREDKFFALFELSSKLQGLCATETDRTNFMLCMEMFRQANKKVMDELLSDKDFLSLLNHLLDIEHSVLVSSAATPGNFGGLTVTVCKAHSTCTSPMMVSRWFRASSQSLDEVANHTRKSYSVQFCIFKFKILDSLQHLDQTRVIEVMTHEIAPESFNLRARPSAASYRPLALTNRLMSCVSGFLSSARRGDTKSDKFTR
ncbi:hypothetical protein BC830DRAFT_1169105 [Chytriomyces sp. MP71]|nr:hypothetical protein BC830DRAFT_1169105 [Chytriomyces sp. MP71]